MIQLHIQRQLISMPRSLQALVSNSLTRSALEDEAREQLASHTVVGSPFDLSLAESTLDWMMMRFSEQVVFNPRKEIQHWFAYTSGAYLEPGYAPLYYFWTTTKPSPNKSAISAIGEGIAGYLAQYYYHCSMLARPNHDYPDIVMETQSADATYLVEAKATIIDEPQKAIEANLLRFVSNTATAELLDVRPLKGLLVSTRIESEMIYRVEYVEVEITA